jgi:hypothetical protein
MRCFQSGQRRNGQRGHARRRGSPKDHYGIVSAVGNSADGEAKFTRIHRSLWRQSGPYRTFYYSLTVILIAMGKPRGRWLQYLIIIRTVCGSKDDQSPLTNAVRSSPSDSCPLPVQLSVPNFHSNTIPTTPSITLEWTQVNIPSLSTAPNSLQSASLSFPSLGGAGVGGGLFAIGGLP